MIGQVVRFAHEIVQFRASLQHAVDGLVLRLTAIRHDH